MVKFAEYSRRPDSVERLSEADGLAIRPAAVGDLEACAAIAAEREGEALEKWLGAFRRLHEASESGESCLLVAEVGSRVVGFGKAARFSPAADAPANSAPAGWYLSGVVVSPVWRRRGIAAQLTRARLSWIATRSDKAYYFANVRNQVSIDLHRGLGFVELTRDFHHPYAQFEGGVGVLFVCELRAKS